MQKPLLITMDTNPDENAMRFMKTLTNLGWPFKLVGTDTTWSSFLERAMIYRTELERVSPNRLCVISDCRDVVCTRSPLRFEEIFKKFNHNIVASGELLCGGSTNPIARNINLNKYNCQPLFQYWDAKGISKDKIPARRYVNAGLVSGYAKDLIKMYNWIISRGIEVGEFDDQLLMGQYFNLHPEEVCIDTEAELLHTTTFGASGGYLSKNQIDDAPTFAELLGRTSFFLHIPGLGMKKGNYLVYQMVAALIDANFSNKKMLEIYKREETEDNYEEDDL